MDIQHFIERRKSMGISQSELCQGICTQATLSRFESQGHLPSLKILMSLCQRLDMNLGELFPATDSQDAGVGQHLQAAELAFIVADYRAAGQHLDAIKPAQLTSLAIKKRYIYLRGFLAALQKSSLSDSFFYLNQLMTDMHTEFEPLYGLLAATGLGMSYANAGEYERADYYFSKVQAGLYEIQPASKEELWRLLNVVFHTALFYASSQAYAQSDQLLQYGVELCSQHAVTHYVDRIFFRLAQNAEAQGLEPDLIREYCADAQALAKLNRNAPLLTRIKQFSSHL